MAVNRRAPAECAVAGAKHPGPAMCRPVFENLARTHRAIAAQTNCPPLVHQRSRSTQRLRKRTANRRATHLQRCEFSISFSSTQTKRHSRDEALHSAESIPFDFLCPLMLPTRLAVGLEPLNALDAAHRSPRSVVGSPVKPVTRRLIKRNKELTEISERKIAASN